MAVRFNIYTKIKQMPSTVAESKGSAINFIMSEKLLIFFEASHGDGHLLTSRLQKTTIVV